MIHSLVYFWRFAKKLQLNDDDSLRFVFYRQRNRGWIKWYTWHTSSFDREKKLILERDSRVKLWHRRCYCLPPSVCPSPSLSVSLPRTASCCLPIFCRAELREGETEKERLQKLHEESEQCVTSKEPLFSHDSCPNTKFLQEGQEWQTWKRRRDWIRREAHKETWASLFILSVHSSDLYTIYSYTEKNLTVKAKTI